MPKLLFSLIAILLIQIVVFGQNTQRSLNAHWTFHKKGESQSYAAKVPGSIYTDLYRNQLIPDPYFGDNEKQLQWIEQESWVYECAFSLSNQELKSQTILLNFQGIDTYAKIYLNDSLILFTQSMFLSYRKAVKPLLKKQNTLRVEILPPLSQIPKGDSIKYSGGPQAHVRKAAFQFGWDWAPRYAAGGIWKNVYLVFQNHDPIDQVHFELLDLDKDTAKYTVWVQSKLLKKGVSKIIISDSLNDIFAETTHIPIPSEDWETISLKIPKPKLWWPRNLGHQTLYTFTIRIEQNGKVLDQVQRKIGIRKIELINKADSMGTSFYFKVNGEPAYVKGVNYVPRDVFVGNASDPKPLLEDVRESGINMIRIWGGGVYESDRFYDLCDSMGIMVWQDFMFANSVYPNNPNFLSLIKQEAHQQVSRLRHHPSIALWCGNNEISEAWHNWGWQGQFGYSPADSTMLWNNYRNIFDTILPQAVAQLSPGSNYWESSPQYGRGNPKSYSHGDLHYWGVWHDGHSFDSLETKTGRFMSEFGFQSYPSISTLEKFCAKEDLQMDNSKLQAHQKHSRGNAIIQKYMMEEYGFVPEKFDDFVYLSQILQAKGIAQGLKAQRRNQPFCMGSMYWQLNDAWPAISWSGIDYYGNWKPLQYAVRDAYWPFLVSHKITEDICSIYTISQLNDSNKTTLRIRVMDFYGATAFDTTISVSQNGKASKLQYQLNISKFNPHKQFVLAEYLLDGGFLLDREFIYLTKDKDLELPKADLEITKRYKNGKTIIHLKAHSLIRNIWLTRTDGKAGRFSDNNFDLAPGERWSVSIESDEEVTIQRRSLNEILNQKNLNEVNH